jgi:2-polyprenyl-3-methyl-5-hydroxy-6-metoxy-1,4-benzoquinol methylase
MNRLKYLTHALSSGRLLKRAQVLSLYAYHHAAQAMNPAWSLERPRMRPESEAPGPVPSDWTDGIEIHLVRDENSVAQFDQPDAARRALVTDIPDKFRSEHCFTCHSPLTPIVQVVDYDRPDDFIEVAWCSACDTVQYSVMPSKSWVSRWYASFWDSSGSTSEKLEERRTTYRYYQRLLPYLPKRKLKVLDIGAGYGEKIRPFALEGHEVHCTEATTRRAEYLRRVVTDNVYFGTLDDPAVRDALRRNGPFDLIFSYHVVEHIYGARQELELLREIGAEDAIFHLAIPELYKEGILNNIYALEHVSSFSRRGAKTLLKEIGYQPIVDKDDVFQYYSNYCQYLIGRKARDPGKIVVEPNSDASRMASYLRDALQLDGLSHLPGSTFSYFCGRPKATYRISETSKAKCREPGRHLPIRIYHHGLPLFWMMS